MRASDLKSKGSRIKLALASCFKVNGEQLFNNAPYIFINRLKGRNVLVQHKAHNQ